ncbi:membrane protein [Armatimonadota bacterium]|nr:membrane protein [Armatimonadota bacterium]
MELPQILSGIRNGNLWMGSLDIFLVAFLIHRLLLLARGTRAVQILGGLATLFLALIVSRRLHLDTLHWLLQQILPLGPVAIVILLYPELRHALEEFGPRFWTRSLNIVSKVDTTEMVTEVVRAIEKLSREKVGALVVFERQFRLDQTIESGTLLNAQVTSSLLLTLFHKGTSLHDGAVIIRKGTIAAAGCLLPLTDRPKVDAEVHTRHKAALGMSENSDAVVLVVSEETGTISLAVNGKLLRGFRSENLREHLNQLLHVTHSDLENVNTGGETSDQRA